MKKIQHLHHNSINFLEDAEFLEHRKNNKHFVFKNLNLVTPSWDEILNLLNQAIVAGDKRKILENLGFVLYNAEQIPSVNEVFSKIKKITDLSCSAHCYISLLEISSTFGRHNDTSDVFFWQVQGKTHWRVEQGSVFEYELSPNDLIYIPRFIFHEVRPLTPRVGISIGIDH